MGARRRHNREHDGPYTEYVKGLVEGGYPNLIQLYNFLHRDMEHKSKAWYLELNLDGQSLGPTEDISRDKLKDMARKPLNDVLARIFVVVDLDTDMIERLGDALSLDATFFSNHISDS